MAQVPNDPPPSGKIKADEVDGQEGEDDLSGAVAENQMELDDGEDASELVNNQAIVNGQGNEEQPNVVNVTPPSNPPALSRSFTWPSRDQSGIVIDQDIVGGFRTPAGRSRSRHRVHDRQSRSQRQRSRSRQRQSSGSGSSRSSSSSALGAYLRERLPLEPFPLGLEPRQEPLQLTPRSSRQGRSRSVRRPRRDVSAIGPWPPKDDFLRRLCYLSEHQRQIHFKDPVIGEYYASAWEHIIARGLWKRLMGDRPMRTPSDSPPTDMPKHCFWTARDPIFGLVHLAKLIDQGKLYDWSWIPRNKYTWLETNRINVSEDIMYQACQQSARPFDTNRYLDDQEYKAAYQVWYWEHHGPWESMASFMSGRFGEKEIREPKDFIYSTPPQSLIMSDSRGHCFLVQAEEMAAYNEDQEELLPTIFRKLMPNESPSKVIYDLSDQGMPMAMCPYQLRKTYSAADFDRIAPLQVRIKDENVDTRQVWRILEVSFLSQAETRIMSGVQPQRHSKVSGFNGEIDTDVIYTCSTADCCPMLRTNQSHESHFESGCIYDGGSHTSWACPTFDNPISREWEAVNKNICFSCGKKGHKANACPSPSGCKTCEGPHWAGVCQSEMAWKLSVKLKMIRSRITFVRSVENCNLLQKLFRYYQSPRFQELLQDYRVNQYYLPSGRDISLRSGVVPFENLRLSLDITKMYANRHSGTINAHYVDVLEELYQIRRHGKNGNVKHMDFLLMPQGDLQRRLYAHWNQQQRPDDDTLGRSQGQTAEMREAVSGLLRLEHIKITLRPDYHGPLPEDLIIECQEALQRRAIYRNFSV